SIGLYQRLTFGPSNNNYFYFMKQPILFFVLIPVFAYSQTPDSSIAKNVRDVMPKVVEWRRYLHKNPELSTREYKTGTFVAEYLKSLGLEVKYPFAKTGVLAILKGGKPGSTVALRADMDALPLTEKVDLPFKSTVTDTLNGQTVGVMHACGHDAH